MEIHSGALLEKTACQQNRLYIPRCFPVCQTLSRRENEDPGKGCREPGCSRARPCCAAELCGVPSIAWAGDVLAGCTKSLGRSKHRLPGPIRLAGSSLQAGLGFRSGSHHQSITWTGATGNYGKNACARKELGRKLGKNKSKIRQLG